MSSTPPPPPPPRLASSECVGYDERWHRWIERFIEVYHAAHSATVPALLLPIEVFASGHSSTLWCITWWWIWCCCSIIWCGPVSNGAGAQRGAFLEQHFAPSVPLPSSPGHLIMFHATRRFSFLRFPFCQFEVYLNTSFFRLPPPPPPRPPPPLVHPPLDTSLGRASTIAGGGAAILNLLPHPPPSHKGGGGPARQLKGGGKAGSSSSLAHYWVELPVSKHVANGETDPS